MATIAVFIALGGSSYAALKLPKNSVGSKQIKRNAVTSAKVKNKSLVQNDFKPGQLNFLTPGSAAAGFLAKGATAANADKLDGLDSSSFTRGLITGGHFSGTSAGADQSRFIAGLGTIRFECNGGSTDVTLKNQSGAGLARAAVQGGDGIVPGVIHIPNGSEEHLASAQAPTPDTAEARSHSYTITPLGGGTRPAGTLGVWARTIHPPTGATTCEAGFSAVVTP